jgi:hypothetical protein
LINHLISPHIQDAEYRWIVPAIGLTFYDTLIADKGSSTAFTSTAYQDFGQSIKILLRQCRSLRSFALYGHATWNKWALYVDNEYGQNVGVEGLKFYQDTLLQRLDVKKKRIKDYLCSLAQRGYSDSFQALSVALS